MARLNIGDKQNWYTRFDPVGSMGNVHYLCAGRTEWEASVIAKKVASDYGQASVTLKRINPKKEK